MRRRLMKNSVDLCRGEFNLPINQIASADVNDCCCSKNRHPRKPCIVLVRWHAAQETWMMSLTFFRAPRNPRLHTTIGVARLTRHEDGESELDQIEFP